MTLISILQVLSVQTEITVGFFFINKIFNAEDIFLEFLCLSDLILIRFDVDFDLDIFKKCIIFFTCVSGISDHILYFISAAVFGKSEYQFPFSQNMM